MFKDRKDAGEKLAFACEDYKDDDPLVLAIPRGGVEPGYEVARHLGAEFSILISRKLPLPNNPEAGFGAIAEDGNLFIFEGAENWLPKDQIEQIVAEQKEVIKDRIAILRDSKPLPSISNRTVILIDDGIAMGSTMYVSIRMCKKQNAGEIIVAVPVADEVVYREMADMVEKMIVLEQPADFRAVAQVYENWTDLTDDDVKKILEKEI
ncbi:phosphoribosyltransferase [candidate division KSB1 bacterium]|nr:phosphoribosyltransferase [candidate division KSB1 bacterium]